MASITLTCSAKQLEQMKKHYSQSLITPPQYSLFAAKINNVRITAYHSGKVVFQGKEAQHEASLWQSIEEHTHLPKNFSQLDIIGSDEVGNGSYFGPLVVVATYVPQSLHPFLESLHVRDSKTMTDQEMMAIYDKIQGKVHYKVMMVKPSTYNQIQPKYNAVHMKAVLHNQALALLEQEITKQNQPLDGFLIDQFTSEKNYRHYIQNENNQTAHPLYFATKGESHHLAVALASIIARVLFLKELHEEEKQLNMTLPIGANHHVDVIAANIIQQYGMDALKTVAKLHFANTKKAKKISET